MIVHTHVSNIKEEKPVVKEIKKTPKKKESKFEEISSKGFIKEEEE